MPRSPGGHQTCRATDPLPGLLPPQAPARASGHPDRGHDHRLADIDPWQAELDELGSQGGDPGLRQALASTWNTLACWIDPHMSAADEILGPAVRDAGTWDVAQAREAIDAHEGIRELIGETYLQLPGSPAWWRLATAVRSAWAGEVDGRERRILPDFAGRSGAAENW